MSVCAWRKPPGLTNPGLHDPVSCSPFPTHEFEVLATNMIRVHIANTTRNTEERAERRRRAAARLAEQFNLTDVPPPTSAPTQSDDSVESDNGGVCSTCQDLGGDGDRSATVECQHTFHLECIDTWVPHTARNPRCPQRRVAVVVSIVASYRTQPDQFQIGTQREASRDDSGV